MFILLLFLFTYYNIGGSDGVCFSEGTIPNFTTTAIRHSLHTHIQKHITTLLFRIFILLCWVLIISILTSQTSNPQFVSSLVVQIHTFKGTMKTTALLPLLIHWQHLSLHLAASSFVSQTSLTPFAKVGSKRQPSFIPRCDNDSNHRMKGSHIILESQTQDDIPISKAPSFNGKTVFPMKVFMNGLKGHKVAAVFAVLNKDHKRG